MKLWTHPLSSETVQRDFRHIGPDTALVSRLRASLAAMLPRGDELTETFYAMLFESHPELRPMFPAEMTAQRQKLLDSLTFIVNHLDRPGEVRAMLRDLGARHVGYGARAAHYPIVRDHLIAAMARVNGAAWTPELRNEWLVAIDMIGRQMAPA